MHRLTTALIALIAIPLGAAAQIGPGDAAPDITLEALSNTQTESLTWDSYGDKLVVLEFWGTWCGPCVAAIPHLNEMAEKLEPRGDVAFLSVTFEDRAKIDAFRKRVSMLSPIGHDTDRSMVNAFGVRSWPTTFLIREGRVLLRTHPQHLTGEQLAKIADGDTATLSFKVAAENWILAKQNKARQDSDATPIVQVSVTRASDEGDISLKKIGGLEYPSMTVIGKRQPAREIIATLWGVEHWQVEAGEWADEARFDFHVHVTSDLHDAAREIVAKAIGVEVDREIRKSQGVFAALAPGFEHKAKAYPATPSGIRTNTASDTITVEATDQSPGYILKTVLPECEMAFELDPSLEKYTVTTTLVLDTRDRDAMLTEIQRKIGVRFEDRVIEKPVLVVTRTSKSSD